MAEELMLEIVTPEELAFSDKVEEVTVPGSEGEFGVLIGHVPLLSAVNYGELNCTQDNKKTYFAIGTGYAEVTDVKVTLLVESAVTALIGGFFGVVFGLIVITICCYCGYYTHQNQSSAGSQGT